MKFHTLRIISWINLFLSILLIFVSFIAILYPFVLVVGAILVIFSLSCLMLYPYKNAFKDKDLSFQKGSSSQWMRTPRRYKTTRRFVRVIWISLFCMLFSFSLMGTLKLHSWHFYIKPLDQELNIHRNIYKKEKERFQPLSKSFGVKK